MRGEHRLREVLRRIKKRRPCYLPNSTEWAGEIEHRLDKLEARQKWLLTLSIATLATVAGVKPELLADIVRRTLQALP